RPLVVAVPWCRARRAVVGRHRLHLKQDAVLPVGRTSARVVRGERLSAASARLDGTAVGSGDGLVQHPAAAGLPAAGAGGDAGDLRRPGPGRRLLGSAGGRVRAGDERSKLTHPATFGEWDATAARLESPRAVDLHRARRLAGRLALPVVL